MRYRVPPRPIGTDAVVGSWEEAERRIDALEMEMRRVDYEDKITAKI